MNRHVLATIVILGSMLGMQAPVFAQDGLINMPNDASQYYNPDGASQYYNRTAPFSDPLFAQEPAKFAHPIHQQTHSSR